MDYIPLQRPAEICEERLISAILSGIFPPDSTLPPERELSITLGVTRPTLRETLQRLTRDGWLEIRHGKPTRVRNYWQEGNLAVLSAICQHETILPNDFVANLLTVRFLLAPTYTQLAIQHNASVIGNLLAGYQNLPDTPDSYAIADWALHKTLTVLSTNPIFTLILNGFHDLYIDVGKRYFQPTLAREISKQFYADLLTCAQKNDSQAAYQLSHKIMLQSKEVWEDVSNAK